MGLEENMIDVKIMVTCFSRGAICWSCINKIKNQKGKFELVIIFPVLCKAAY